MSQPLMPAKSKHIMISATDEEWETVRSCAMRWRRFIERCSVVLVSTEGTGDRRWRSKTREQRPTHSLLIRDGNAGSLVADIQVRTVAMFFFLGAGHHGEGEGT